MADRIIYGRWNKEICGKIISETNYKFCIMSFDFDGNISIYRGYVDVSEKNL